MTKFRPRGLRTERTEPERFRAIICEEILACDKANVDIIWLKDDSLEDAADLPAPEVIALEIAEELENALSEINAIVAALEGNK